MDAVAALEESYGRMAELVGAVGSDQLSAPTPCAGWDVRALLNHTFGAGWMFTLVNQGKTVGEDAGDLVGDDPSAALSQLAPANVSVWREPGALEGDRSYPFGTFPAQAGLLINLGEVVVHAWDLGRATSHPIVIDPVVAGLLWDFYSQVPMDQYRQHGAFGAEISVPETETSAARLLAYLGRQP